MQGKKCTKCLEIKDLDDFAIDFRSRTGTMSACKACNNEYARARLAAKTPESRTCLQCYQNKGLDDFALSRTGKYGRRAVCKDCIAEETRRKRAGAPVAGINFDESWERFRETWQPLSEDVIAHWRAAFDRDMGKRAR